MCSDQESVFAGSSAVARARPGDGRGSSRTKRFVGLAPVGLLVTAALLVGCGSSKPAYCTKVSELKKSVQDLPNVKLVQNGTTALNSALDKTKGDAQAVVSSAKSDFPRETSAIRSSVDALSKSAQQLSSSPTAAITALPGDIASATTAVKNLANATSSKCG
jgi:hypothetical protein